MDKFDKNLIFFFCYTRKIDILFYSHHQIIIPKSSSFFCIIEKKNIDVIQRVTDVYIIMEMDNKKKITIFIKLKVISQTRKYYVYRESL